MIRSYNCHFYHFASVSTNGEKRQQAELNGHNYAKYKWGSIIKHKPENNLKYVWFPKIFSLYLIKIKVMNKYKYYYRLDVNKEAVGKIKAESINEAIIKAASKKQLN